MAGHRRGGQLTRMSYRPYVALIRRLGGRGSKAGNGAVEESPGSTETRCRVAPGGGDPRESAAESRPPAIACLQASAW